MPGRSIRTMKSPLRAMTSMAGTNGRAASTPTRALLGVQAPKVRNIASIRFSSEAIWSQNMRSMLHLLPAPTVGAAAHGWVEPPVPPIRGRTPGCAGAREAVGASVLHVAMETGRPQSRRPSSGQPPSCLASPFPTIRAQPGSSSDEPVLQVRPHVDPADLERRPLRPQDLGDAPGLGPEPLSLGGRQLAEWLHAPLEPAAALAPALPDAGDDPVHVQGRDDAGGAGAQGPARPPGRQSVLVQVPKEVDRHQVAPRVAAGDVGVASNPHVHSVLTVEPPDGPRKNAAASVASGRNGRLPHAHDDGFAGGGEQVGPPRDRTATGGMRAG